MHAVEALFAVYNWKFYPNFPLHEFIESQEAASEANETSQEVPLSVGTTPAGAADMPSGVVVCHSRYHEIWMLVLYAYKALVLLYGTHLSWATRNVTLTAMNDARCIIISVYTCVILVSLSTAFSTTLWRWPNIWYFCLAAVILTCATQVLVLLHIPKVSARTFYSSLRTKT